ncbi:hypothetical protein ABK040_001428 [Willaertia magna]
MAEIKPTDFDNKFLSEVKLKELPKFLKQHANSNGLFRLNLWFTRFFTPTFFKPRRHRFPLLVIALLGAPGVYRAITSQSLAADAIINARFGEEFNNFSDYQKNYVRTRVLKIMAENR